MAGKKNIMNAIKRAVSPSRQTGTESMRPAPSLQETTPFTRYVLDNLDLRDNEHKLLTMTFAPQIHMDCEANVLDFDKYFHLLGHKSKADALRTLKRVLTDAEIVFSRSC